MVVLEAKLKVTILQCSNIDIVLGCESHIDESYFSSELLPPPYTILRKNRSLGGGGVLLGFKKASTVSEEPKLITDCEVIWSKLHFKKTKTYICSFYRPPDSDMYPIIQLNKSLTKLSNREPMVLVGWDFNFQDIAWIDGYGTIRPNPACGFEINNLFLSTIGDNNLEQLVHKPTRNKNILDLIFSSYPALVSDLSVILGISDHDAVLFSFNAEGIITNNPRHYIYLYQKADLGGILNHMKTFLDNFISTDPYKKSVEQNWLLFKGAIHEVLEKYIPKR